MAVGSRARSPSECRLTEEERSTADGDEDLPKDYLCVFCKYKSLNSKLGLDTYAGSPAIGARSSPFPDADARTAQT